MFLISLIKSLTSKCHVYAVAVILLLGEIMPSYSYYKEENYLKVKTVVFKYITPPYSKGWVYWYVSIFSILHSHIPMFLCSKLSLYITYIT